MYYLKWFLSWFGVGFICLLLGILSDFILYGKKPSKGLSNYIVPILAGYVCIPILLKSILNGIIIWLRK